MLCHVLSSGPNLRKWTLAPLCHPLSVLKTLWSWHTSAAAPRLPDSSAVIRFRGVSWVHFGPPSDERLSDHPLYQFGLSFYAFWEVLDSPKIATGSPQRHWIATFHDETLEVVADTASVQTQSVQGTATCEIARRYV
jgi:hypothetical protein